MTLINPKTKEPLSYVDMLEERIITLQRICHGAMIARQFAAATAADKQLAGALIALQRENRRSQRECV
jgi:hypothetical protein